VTGHRRKLYNEELHNLYSSLNIVRVIKSRSVRWVGHVVQMVQQEMRTEFWLESTKGRDHLKDVGVNGRIILKLFLGK
jgi:hypothetical protein